MVWTFLGLGLHFGMDFDRGWSRRSDLVWTYIEHNQYKYSFSILFSRLRVRGHRSCLPLPSWSPTVLAITRYGQQIAPARLPADRQTPVVWTNIEHRRPDRPWYGLVSNLAPPLAQSGMDFYRTSDQIWAVLVWTCISHLCGLSGVLSAIDHFVLIQARKASCHSPPRLLPNNVHVHWGRVRR